MRRTSAVLAMLVELAACHPTAEQPAPETNATALEANLEREANAMEAQADAAADRNVADALAANDAAQANGPEEIE